MEVLLGLKMFHAFSLFLSMNVMLFLSIRPHSLNMPAVPQSYSQSLDSGVEGNRG